MARPVKDGLDYFPLDTNFFDNRKIRLIRAQTGIEGVFVALALISEIYRTGGYYRRWDDEDCLLMSEDLARGVPSDKIADIVEKCLERDLFDRGVYERCGVLTSRGIQRQYVRIAAKRRVMVPVIKEYLLLDPDNELDVPPNVGKKLKLVSIERNAPAPEQRSDGPKCEQIITESVMSGHRTGNTQNKSNQNKSNKTISEHITSHQIISAGTEAVSGISGDSASDAYGSLVCDDLYDDDTDEDIDADDIDMIDDDDDADDIDMIDDDDDINDDKFDYDMDDENNGADSMFPIGEEKRTGDVGTIYETESGQSERVCQYILQRPAGARELEEIARLREEYGSKALSAGIDAAIKAGGRSVSYLGKCVRSRAEQNRRQLYDTPPPEIPYRTIAGNGRYSPTFDIKEIERMLDEEWLASFEDDGNGS